MTEAASMTTPWVDVAVDDLSRLIASAEDGELALDDVLQVFSHIELTPDTINEIRQFFGQRGVALVGDPDSEAEPTEGEITQELVAELMAELAEDPVTGEERRVARRSRLEAVGWATSLELLDGVNVNRRNERCTW